MYYLEHVLARPWTFRYLVQQTLTKLGLWKLLLDGCKLDRNTDQEILKAGFSHVDQQRINIDTSGLIVFSIIAPHVLGVATKKQ